MSYKSFIDSINQDTSNEDERRRAKLAERIKAEKAQSATKEKSPIENIGDFLGGVGKFITSIPGEIVKSTGEALNIAGTGIGRAVDEVTGARQARDDEYKKQQDDFQSMLLKQIAKKKDPNSTDEDRARAEASIKSLTSAINQNYTRHKQELDQLTSDVDPVKQAGATVELASIPLTMVGGTTARVAKTAAEAVGKEVAKETGKQVLKKAGTEVLSDVALGAVGGAGSVAKEKGSQATQEDYMRGAGTGALLSGALSTGGQLLSKPVRSEVANLSREGIGAIKSNVEAYNALPRSIKEGGYVKLPGSTETPETIAKAVQPETTVAAQVAKTPEVDPVTGLIDTALPEGSGVVTKSREQIMKDNKVQKSFKDKVVEQFFDRTNALKAYSEKYKAKTGQDLAVEDDPHALAQLRNGMDDAGAARLQPLVEDMDYIRKNKLADAWSEYGIANQVVNDRADKYSPAVVEAERAKLANLEATLPPEQLDQVKAAVQRTIDFQDEQLARLRDNGFISKEGYDAIKEVNPNYFSRFNIAEYIQDNQRLFASTNSNNISKNIVQAVKGVGDDSKFIIEDPAEAITRAAIKTENLIQQNKIFQAIKRLGDTLPEMSIKIRDAENVANKIDLSLENKELRPILNKLDRMIKTDNRTARKLQSEINKLNQQGLNVALKGGGERMSVSDINVGTLRGLGGELSTSKSGQLVKTATDDATDLVKQLEGAKRVSPESATTKGLQQDVIAEGAGTMAETTPSMLGKQDTASFLRNLIESGSRKDIDSIKRKIGNRDPKLADLIDNIGYMKSEYDDIAGKIRSNIDEAKAMADKQVPDGYEIIEGVTNGIQEKIAVPQYVADAYKGKNDIQTGILDRVMMASSKPFKAAATIFSPAFLVKNGIRDTGTHWLTSANIPVKERLFILPYAKRWAEGFLDAFTGGEMSQKISLEGGGAAGIFNDVGQTQDLVKGMAKKLSGEEVKTADGMFKTAAKMVGKYTGASKLAGAYAGGMKKLGRSLEYAPRLAEAKAAIENGASDPAAALAARKALGDLQNGGTVSRVINNYTPFFNSILQGNLRVVQSLKENPKNGVAMMSAGIAAPAVAGYVWNRTMYPDVLNNISQSERENNFIIILGDNKDENGRYTDVIKIPKNDAAKMFGNNIEVAMDKFAGQDSQGFAELFMKTIGYASPLQVQKDGDLSLQAMVGSAPVTSSPLIKVPFELATNTSLYTGRDIVPENKKGLSPEEQASKTTTGADVGIAQVLDPIAGLAGADVAPQQIAQIRQGASAGLLSGKNPIEQVSNVVTGAAGSRGSSEFYKLRDTVAEDRARASAAINRAIEANNIEAAQDIASRYNAKFKETFMPWVKTYGSDADADMQDAFSALKLNLTNRSIKQRLKNIQKNADQ